MSDYDKSKDVRRRRYYSSQRDRENPSYLNLRRGLYNKYERENSREFERNTNDSKEKSMPQPTILLKNRESNQTRTVSPKRVTSSIKEPEPSTPQPKQIQKSKSSSVDLSQSLWCPPYMKHSVPLIDENFMFVEDVQEYLQDNSSDFLVVGIIGSQGVGKSTIMNMLIDDNLHKISNYKERERSGSTSDGSKINDIELNLKNLSDNFSNLNVQQKDSTELLNCESDEAYFKVQSIHELERGIHCTVGLNAYITPNRTILLDSQPILSVSNLDEMIQTGSAATAAGEIISTENSSEIQSLQLAAFLLTVCHVVIVVQDWFFDPNVIRFIQTGEMLKPSLTTAGEEELNEHSPHLLLLHNKARVEDFNPPQFKIIQQTYRSLFNKSKLKLDTGLGIGTGNILHSLCSKTCGEPLNIFLLPNTEDEEEVEEQDPIVYRGYPKLDQLIYKLKSKIQGATRNQLTHTQLSEKAWLHYASKAWEGVKKSSFFVEYNKLLP